MLAPVSKAVDSHSIEKPDPNPYLQLRKRKFSEPLILLLLFVLGVWLWDNHLSTAPLPHEPTSRAETWEISLRKTDRDLRLASGTSHFPNWARVMLGVDPLERVLETRLEALDPLIASRNRHQHEPDPLGDQMADEGAFAVGVMTSIHHGGHATTAPFQQLGIAGPPATEEILARIIEGKEHWWDLAYLESLELDSHDAEASRYALELGHSRTQRLVGNMIKTRGAFAVLTVGGLVFIPGTLIAFLRIRQPRGYIGRWTMSFGLGVFLLSYLAYLGFSLTFNQAIDHFASWPSDEPGPLMSTPVFIALDSITRFLPALIAIALLFRRPRHAFSRLGMGGPLDLHIVLGCFSILQIIEFGLRMTVDRHATPDPTGGLSVIEAGLPGLGLALVSACIAAPIAEEILYRGVLYRSLANRLPLVAAVTISSVMFALVHFYSMPSLFLIACLGATCALGFSATRSILTAIVLHALYNASIKIPEWVIYQTSLS